MLKEISSLIKLWFAFQWDPGSWRPVEHCPLCSCVFLRGSGCAVAFSSWISQIFIHRERWWWGMPKRLVHFSQAQTHARVCADSDSEQVTDIHKLSHDLYLKHIYLFFVSSFVIPALQSLWGEGDYKQEMDEMSIEQAAIEVAPLKSPLQLLRDRTVRWQLITMSTVYFCNQLSGMSVVRKVPIV